MTESTPTDESEGTPAAAGDDVTPIATPEEEAAADRAFDDPELSGDHQEVARHYREMTELGANVKGEGQLP